MLVPHIIYSVLDFSSYNGLKSEKEIKKIRKAAVKKEIVKIREALMRLYSGKSAASDLERRIEKLYSGLSGRSKYKKAAQDKQIRFQSGILERFRDGIRRSGQYLYAIEDIFRAKGLPLELSRLAFG